MDDDRRLFGPDDDQDEDLSYEDVDDMLWADTDDLEIIDLDSLDSELESFVEAGADDAVRPAPSDEPRHEPLPRRLRTLDLDALDDALEPEDHDDATETLLSSIDALDDDLEADDEVDDESVEPLRPPVPLTRPGADRPQPFPPARRDLRALDLDALDDDLEPEDHDDATEALLDSLDALDDEVRTSAPPRVPGMEPRPRPSTPLVPRPAAPPPAPPGQQPTARPPAPGEPAAPPDVIYQAIIPLPAELGARVLELRESGQIADMPPPGVPLTVAFRATDRARVEGILGNWTRQHLPLQIEITGVIAEIVGSQQYVAAWSLQPEEELSEARDALHRALAPAITPVPDTYLASQARVAIGDRVTARFYPRVVAEMQQQFESFVWVADGAALASRTLDTDADEWIIARAFE